MDKTQARISIIFTLVLHLIHTVFAAIAALLMLAPLAVMLLIPAVFCGLPVLMLILF